MGQVHPQGPMVRTLLRHIRRIDGNVQVKRVMPLAGRVHHALILPKADGRVRLEGFTQPDGDITLSMEWNGRSSDAFEIMQPCFMAERLTHVNIWKGTRCPEELWHPIHIRKVEGFHGRNFSGFYAAYQDSAPYGVPRLGAINWVDKGRDAGRKSHTIITAAVLKRDRAYSLDERLLPRSYLEVSGRHPDMPKTHTVVRIRMGVQIGHRLIKAVDIWRDIL